jgi:hypothetical protein
LPSYTATDRELERRTDQHVDLQHLGHHQSGRRRSLRRGRHNRGRRVPGCPSQPDGRRCDAQPPRLPDPWRGYAWGRPRCV